MRGDMFHVDNPHIKFYKNIYSASGSHEGERQIRYSRIKKDYDSVSFSTKYFTIYDDYELGRTYISLKIYRNHDGYDIPCTDYYIDLSGLYVLTEIIGSERDIGTAFVKFCRAEIL